MKKKLLKKGSQDTADQQFKNTLLSAPTVLSRRKYSLPYQLSTNEQQEPVKSQVYKRSNKSKVCAPFVLLTPRDMLYYQSIQQKLQQMTKEYSHVSFLKFLEKNLSYHGISNIDNFTTIKDQEFQNQTLPILIPLVLQNLKAISHSIRILKPQKIAEIQLTRLQILMILASMFFGIMPNQVHNRQTTFGQWMAINKKNDKSPDSAIVRKEKLKCLIQYFKRMVKSPQIYSQIVKYHRSCIQAPQSLIKNNQFANLTKVTIRSAQNGKIQDYYGQSLMIDFSNKKIGGDIMKNGHDQEEILFSIFPEAIVARLICDQIQDNEAVAIYGAKKFVKYSGYQLSFTCQGPFTSEKQEDYSKSILIAIDALKLKRNQNPFTQHAVDREIVKASIGFMSADSMTEHIMPICTGAWGCEVSSREQFPEEVLKLFIQWVACSIAKKDMIYVCQKNKVTQFEVLVDELQQRGYKVRELRGILQQYEYAVIMNSLCKKKPSLLQYLKDYV